MEVKDLIRTRRLSLNLTMKDLAQKVGVTEATISRWESGDIENMRRDKISALSKALHIPLEVLMGWEDITKDNAEIEQRISSLELEIAQLKADEIEIVRKLLRSKYRERMLEYAKKLLNVEDMENELE